MIPLRIKDFFNPVALIIIGILSPKSEKDFMIFHLYVLVGYFHVQHPPTTYKQKGYPILKFSFKCSNNPKLLVQPKEYPVFLSLTSLVAVHLRHGQIL